MRDANQEPAALLRDAKGNPVVLTGVTVRGHLTETLASVEVEQRYLNPFDHNIEAVYTFPLPIGAVLLDVAVDLDGRILSGQVVERKVAEWQYEDAITDGNSVVMITDAGNGLYTMNLGNLMAREAAVIRYRYALALAWQGDRLRLLIPTTVAPRYGDPQAAGLNPWDAPESDILVEYPFDLSIAIDGKLADGEIASPTHPLNVARNVAGMQVKLSRTACLDRDFVLTVASREAAASSLLVSRDGESQVAFASLRIPPLQSAAEAPLCLKVVIDCSGSMAGSSIIQARKGALAILDQLRPQDFVNITFFGSSREHMFPQLMPCERETLQFARERLLRLDADMGGTETGAALDAVYKLSGKSRQLFENWQAANCPAGHAAVLLITDGEIWGAEDVIRRAENSAHRVFTVGVGMAVAEGFVTEIARATGGACELVAPQEGMGERILAQFHRLRQPGIVPIEMTWDVPPLWQTTLPKTLFAGDTVHVFAGFGEAAASRLEYKGGTVGMIEVSRVELPDIPRLAAYARIQALADQDSQKALDLALRHQLLTNRTSFLVVAERVAKAEDLPELQKVPHMLAAGMFEASQCMSHSASFDMGIHVSHFEVGDSFAASAACESRAVFHRASPAFDDLVDDIAPPAVMRRAKSESVRDFSILDIEEVLKLEEPPRNTELIKLPGHSSPGEFVANLNRKLERLLRIHELPNSVEQLETYGLPSEIAATIRQEIDRSSEEAAIVITFLYALSESPLSGCFERDLRRLVVRAWKQQRDERGLEKWFTALLGKVDENSWNWGGIRILVETEASS